MEFRIKVFNDDTFEIYWGGYDEKDHTDAQTEHYEYNNPYDICECLEQFIHYYVELKD